MNEKERSVLTAWDAQGAGGLEVLVRELEARGWSYASPGICLRRPALPTPHWRDLPAGPELDRIVHETLHPQEVLRCVCGYESAVLHHSPPRGQAGVCWAAYPPRSTDLALAMEMMKSLEYVQTVEDHWEIYVHGAGPFRAANLAQVPYEICRAKLAAHEAGR